MRANHRADASPRERFRSKSRRALATLAAAQNRQGRSFCPAKIQEQSLDAPAVTALIDALGYAAASLTTVSFVPQAMKTLRSGDTSAISLRMYLLFTSGVALWGIYGLLLGDGPLIVSNAITVVSAGLILERKLRAVLAGRRSGPPPAAPPGPARPAAGEKRW